MKRALSARRPSAAMVVATTALFLALGGTGYAAFSLPKNSVGTKQLKKGAVTTRKIKNGAVTAKKINPAGLTVPNATHATSADNAGHANSADGLTVLPSGQSESGAFSAGGANSTTPSPGYVGFGITYPRPLATPIPDGHIIDVTGSSAPHCPGFGRADPNYLCLYDTVRNSVDPGYGYSSDAAEIQQSPSVGVILYWQVNAADAYVGGEWTVTAP